MPLYSVVLNLLWIVFGGWWMALGWLIAAIVMVFTIVGLPWAGAAFHLAWYTLLPFGQTVVSREAYTGRPGFADTRLGVLGNIIWLILAGWWLALGHVLTAIGLALTIIGLPFAWAHLKLAGFALWPLGRMVVSVEDAEIMAHRPWASSYRGSDEPWRRSAM